MGLNLFAMPSSSVLLFLLVAFGVHARPWDGAQQTHVYLEDAWSPKPTAVPVDPAKLFKRASVDVNVCGWIGGASSNAATCSSGSSCIHDTMHGYVGCCATDGPCTAGVYTSCLDQNSAGWTPNSGAESNGVYTCASSSVCYKNTYPGNYYQWGCGSSNWAAQVATTYSGQATDMLLQVVYTGVDFNAKYTSSTSSSSSSTTSTSSTSTSLTSSASQAAAAAATKSKSDSGTNTGVIVGGSLAGVFGLILLALALCWFGKRQQRKRQEQRAGSFISGHNTRGQPETTGPFTRMQPYSPEDYISSMAGYTSNSPPSSQTGTTPSYDGAEYSSGALQDEPQSEQLPTHYEGYTYEQPSSHSGPSQFSTPSNTSSEHDEAQSRALYTIQPDAPPNPFLAHAPGGGAFEQAIPSTYQPSRDHPPSLATVSGPVDHEPPSEIDAFSSGYNNAIVTSGNMDPIPETPFTPSRYQTAYHTEYLNGGNPELPGLGVAVPVTITTLRRGGSGGGELGWIDSRRLRDPVRRKPTPSHAPAYAEPSGLSRMDTKSDREQLVRSPDSEASFSYIRVEGWSPQRLRTNPHKSTLTLNPTPSPEPNYKSRDPSPRDPFLAPDEEDIASTPSIQKRKSRSPQLDFDIPPRSPLREGMMHTVASLSSAVGRHDQRQRYQLVDEVARDDVPVLHSPGQLREIKRQALEKAAT